MEIVIALSHDAYNQQKSSSIVKLYFPRGTFSDHDGSNKGNISEQAHIPNLRGALGTGFTYATANVR